MAGKAGLTSSISRSPNGDISWVAGEETDAITRTPIFEGEPVVMVIIEEGRTPDSLTMDSYDGIGSNVHSIHKGTYNDYGWIAEIDCPPGAVGRL